MFKISAGLRDKLSAKITTIPAILNKKHLQGLDGLRGVSILLVLISHCTRGTRLSQVNLGGVGVETFFIISGFLITTLLLKEHVKNGKVNLKNFYIRRLLRIFPVAYLFLLVLIVLNYCLHLSISTKSFVTAALYLKNIPFKNGGEWYTGHFWSLSVEEQFYLIFPFLLVRNVNRYIVITLSFIVLIPLIEAVGYNNWHQNNKLFHVIIYTIINVFGKRTISILIGSLASILAFKGILNEGRLRTNYWLSAVLFIGVLILNCCFYNTYLSPLIYGVVVSFIMLNNLQQQTLLLKVLENKALRLIGVLSYSIYIWQQLFTYYQPWRGLFPNADSIALNMIALALVSSASYYLYELKFLKLKHRFISKPVKS